uniref:Uncharacterized protein n=1 Tax=Populus trichocarpa TaxID=3694 RepID=A0A3N7E989_POPTR
MGREPSLFCSNSTLFSHHFDLSEFGDCISCISLCPLAILKHPQSPLLILNLRQSWVAAMGLWNLFIVALMPVLNVLLITAVGVFLAIQRVDILGADLESI